MDVFSVVGSSLPLVEILLGNSDLEERIEGNLGTLRIFHSRSADTYFVLYPEPAKDGAFAIFDDLDESEIDDFVNFCHRVSAVTKTIPALRRFVKLTEEVLNDPDLQNHSNL